MQVMKWIEQEVAAAIDRGETQIQWVTPSGFVVTQRLMKLQTQRIELQLLGRCRCQSLRRVKPTRLTKHITKTLLLRILSIVSMQVSCVYLHSVSTHRFPSYTTRFYVVLLTWVFFQPLFVRHTCTYLRSMTTSRPLDTTSVQKQNLQLSVT